MASAWDLLRDENEKREMMKRFIVEFGTGVDLHGGDNTKAAKKAVKDAISHCCLCGLHDALGLDDMSRLKVVIKVGVPSPEKLDVEELKVLIPFGTVEVEEVVVGGLSATGMHVDSMGEGDQIVIANAALTVWVDI